MSREELDHAFPGNDFQASLARSFDRDEHLIKQADQPHRTDAEVANELVRLIRREVRAGRLPRGTHKVTRSDGSPWGNQLAQRPAQPLSDEEIAKHAAA